MKRMVITTSILFLIGVCIFSVKWGEIQDRETEAKNVKIQEELQKQNEGMGKAKLSLRKKHQKARERSKYLSPINYSQFQYRKVNGTNTNDFSKLNFSLDDKEDIVSKGVSSFTTKDGTVYSIADDEKVIAIKPQEYSLELTYKFGELICRDNDNGACEEMGMVSRSRLEDYVSLPEENIKELKEKRKNEQDEYIKKWEENWKKREEEMGKMQIANIKEERQKLEILERNRKLFENTKLLNLIADIQNRYHRANGRYTSDFNELNFNLDNIDGIVSKERSRFTTENGIVYTMDSTRITAIATKSKYCFIEKYYNGTTNCQDNGNGCCAEMGLISKSMSEQNNTMYKQTNGSAEERQKQIQEMRNKDIERMKKVGKNPASRILGLISNAEHNYYRSNGTYTDDFSKLNFSLNNIDVLSKDTSSFTTKDGLVYSIKDKENATATKPQQYILKVSYKTSELICRDIANGSCDEIGMTSKFI